MKSKKILLPILLSALLTFFQLVGYYISDKYSTSVHYTLIRFWNASSSKVIYLLVGVTEFILFSALFYFWFRLLGTKSSSEKELIVLEHTKGRFFPFLYPLTAILLFLCWLPYLLASNPGFFNYDVTGQLAQVMYDTVPYVNHHPLFHTLIMGGIINFFYLRSGENLQTGILAFSIFQMIFCSMAFTYFIYFLRKVTCRIWPLVMAFLYYAFLPTIALFTMSTTKDVMCLVLLQIAVLKMYEAFTVGLPAFYQKKSNFVVLLLSLSLSCLMRKNVAYAICMVMLLILLFLRRKGLSIFFTLFFSVLLFMMIEKGCMVVLHATNGGAAEAFSVPFQQIARVYNQYGEDGFTPDQWEMTLSLIDEESLRGYNPVLADPIKNHSHFDVVEADKAAWLKYWISLGLKHPTAYVMSFLENTYQAWYPGTSIIVNPMAHQIYYFDCNMSLDVERFSKLPGFLHTIEQISLGEYYQKIPVIRLLFSIGAMLWLVLIGFTYGLYSKNKGIIWSGLLVLALCATNFLGPVSLVRYYLILFYGFPFWFTLLTRFQGKN